MDLQPYSHYCFPKISEPLFDFLNNTYWVSKRQSHVDFVKNDYSVSLFSRNNLLAKTYFSWNPNFLLLHISFLFSINQHRYNHDRFSKISRSFCGSRNWWIIIVFFEDNSVKFTILSQKISRPSPTFPLRSFLKNIKNILCK